VFVLLAGFSANYAYGSIFFHRGAAIAAKAILRRTGVIYVANLVLICGLWAEVALLDESRTGKTVVDILELNGLRNISIDEFGALLSFRYQCSFIDILPLYIMLLLGFAVVLPLLRFPRVLLSLSIGLYVATYLCNLHIPGIESASHVLNPLAWQLLLVIGAVLVIQPLTWLRLPVIWDSVAVSVLLVAFGIRLTVHLIHNDYELGFMGRASWAPILAWMQESILVPSWKTKLHPLRVVNILAWAWLAYRLATFYDKWLRYPWVKPLILCGQQSLPVFCCGVLLAPLGGMLLAAWPGVAAQVIYNVVGAAISVLTAALAAAHKLKRHQTDQASGFIRPNVRSGVPACCGKDREDHKTRVTTRY
jgi:hypothetical protein